MKYGPQLHEHHVMEILLKNIRGPISLILKGFIVKKFEKLMSKSSILKQEKF